MQSNKQGFRLNIGSIVYAEVDKVICPFMVSAVRQDGKYRAYNMCDKSVIVFSERDTYENGLVMLTADEVSKRLGKRWLKGEKISSNTERTF